MLEFTQLKDELKISNNKIFSFSKFSLIIKIFFIFFIISIKSKILISSFNYFTFNFMENFFVYCNYSFISDQSYHSIQLHCNDMFLTLRKYLAKTIYCYI